MSVRVQTYVWQLELSPYQKLVAIALADHCHDDGSDAFPSQALLAKKTALNERSIRRILHQLVDLGVIVLTKPSRQHRANCYSFMLPEDFATLRGGAVSGLTKTQGGQGNAQGGHSRPPEGTQCPPNHKEPLLETANSISVPMPEGFRESLGLKREPHS
jgi:hypothetical protein